MRGHCTLKFLLASLIASVGGKEEDSAFVTQFVPGSILDVCYKAARAHSCAEWTGLLATEDAVISIRPKIERAHLANGMAKGKRVR